MTISTTSLTTTTLKAQAAVMGTSTHSLYTSLAELPRVRRHGKRAWELLRRANRFVLVDAAGDYYVDRAGNASRPGEVSVHVSKLLDPEKREVRR